MVDKKVLKTKLTEMFIEDNILHVVFNNSSYEFDLKEAQDQIKNVKELTNSQPYRILVDTINSFQTPTNEAREMLASYPNKIAEGIVIKYLHQRLTSTFYLKLSHNKMKHPAKVFSNRNQAKLWLMEFDD